MAQFSNSFSATALLGVFALMMSMGAQAETSASTKFTATIGYEGACDIDVPTQVLFNSGDAVLPSQIEGQDSVAQRSFNLTLSGCQGIGLTPKIVLTGLSNTDTNTPLYLDAASSTSKGYGILLATIGNATFDENLNLAAKKMIEVKPGWNTQNNLTTLNGSIPLTATLSCGSCSQAGRIGGGLVANVTFEFQYD